jgi:hypothetical protein
MQNLIKIGFTRSTLFIAALGLAFSGLSAPAWGGCSPMEILELYQAGYTRAQVDEICGNAAAEQPSGVRQQQQPGYHCSTPYGWCPMQAPAAIGSACACYTVYGAIEGVVVE